jgi:hypothetical protein
MNSQAYTQWKLTISTCISSDWPVVSLDKLRRKLGVDPEDAQDRVVNQAKEQAKIYLRQN